MKYVSAALIEFIDIQFGMEWNGIHTYIYEFYKLYKNIYN